jgi:hypothetical protein
MDASGAVSYRPSSPASFVLGANFLVADSYIFRF